MKKTMVQKTIATLTAFLAVSAMALPMAVSAVNTPTINAEPAYVITPANTADVPVKKDIVLFNVDGSSILSPNITYSYEVTPANVTNATITTYAQEDIDTTEAAGTETPGAAETPVPITVTVKPGVIGAVSIGTNTASDNKVRGSITFGEAGDTTNNNTTKHDTNKESVTTVDLTKKVSGSMTIAVDATKIYDTDNDTKQNNGPGVYRYKIEDVTTAATLTASGIQRSYVDNEDKYIYLDVYTKYNENKDGLVIYGYVLLKDVTGKDNVSITYDKTHTDETLKITGFDTESENKETYNEQTVEKANLTSDAYHTYNVEVSKKTDGDLADTQHNFPFKIELTNANVTFEDDFYYQITKDGQTKNEVITHLENNGSLTLDGNGTTPTTENLQLQNGDKILITGLPVNTKIKVTETNDTKDTYSVSAKDESNVELTLNGSKNPVSVAAGGNAEMTVDTEYPLNNTAELDKIEFTNTLKDISITGLLFNVAPFTFITVAGSALLGLFMKNKRNSESENKI